MSWKLKTFNAQLAGSICDLPHSLVRQLSLAVTCFSAILDISISLKIVMQFPVLLPGALSELFAQVSISGYITKADRYGLMAALLQEGIDSEEIRVIDRLLRAIRRGHISLVEEISAVVF